MSSTSVCSQFAQENLSLLGSLPLFRGVDNDVLQRLAQGMHKKSMKKRCMVFSQDDEGVSFYIVTEGAVKLFRETPMGEECVSDIVTAGEMFGEGAVFNSGQYDFSAESVKDTVLIYGPLHVLRELLDHDTVLSQNMMDRLALGRRRQLSEIENQHYKSASERIGCFLLGLCHAQVPQEHKGDIKIELPYGKTDIAGKLSMKPETFSRGIKRLSTDLNVSVDSRKVHIPDFDALVRYSCSQCSHVHPCVDLRD